MSVRSYRRFRSHSGFSTHKRSRRTQSGATITTTFVYGLDGLGSTRTLADSAGVVTDRYSYDVYGAMRAQTGATANQFDFAGEQSDHGAQRGLQYLRARHYDPGLGRFLSKDPVAFVNRYAYVGGDPVNLADPLGLCGWSDPWDCDGDDFVEAASAAKRAVIEAGHEAVACIGDVSCSSSVSTRIDAAVAWVNTGRAMFVNGMTIAGCVSGGAVGCLLAKGIGEIGTSQIAIYSNLASVVSTAISCSGRFLGESKEGGGFTSTNTRSCGATAGVTAMGLVPESNLDALAAQYQYQCRDLNNHC